MNKATEMEYPPTPKRPFECLRLNLILNKMPADQKCQYFHIYQAMDGRISLMEFSKATIILKVSENST